MDKSLEDESKAVVDMIHFRIIWNKQNYDVTFDPNETVRNLKKHIETLTGLQKHETSSKIGNIFLMSKCVNMFCVFIKVCQF